jgi:hypothetical protein
MADDTTRGTASFVSEMGVLKRVARTGWWFTGNKAPESVAEHASWQAEEVHREASFMTCITPAGSAWW